MQRQRWNSRKHRLSTRDRFISVLRGGTEKQEKSIPWFRRREIFYPLLMIFVFFMLTFVVKSVFLVQNHGSFSSRSQAALHPSAGQPDSAPTLEKEEEMSYEEAKRIFGGTGP